MRAMFYECESLKSLDLSNFNTENVNNMESIFKGCKSLTKQKVIIRDEKLIQQLIFLTNIFQMSKMITMNQ